MKEYFFTYEDRDFIINVGQNAKENWQLIDDSEDWDLWFHVEDKPSGHVVVKEKLKKNNKIDIKNNFFGYPYELIVLASQYCKSQSKEKYSKVSIIYTTINNIKKGNEIGSVITKNTKSIVL
jgi:predicted ribosome quality control (RQC) complex YloA/Tae2 family protein